MRFEPSVSLVEIARQTEYSIRQVSAIRNGHSPIHKRFIASVVQAFGPDARAWFKEDTCEEGTGSESASGG